MHKKTQNTNEHPGLRISMQLSHFPSTRHYRLTDSIRSRGRGLKIDKTAKHIIIFVKMTVTDDSNDATNGGDGSEAAMPEEESGMRDDEVGTDDRNLNEDGGAKTKAFMKCFKLFGGFYHRAIAAWPRTSALAFGVVLPLFLLIALSVFFGYFLAQFEGPGEIDHNNDVISTRIALALQDQLVGNITENLPYLCACTYLKEIKKRGIYDEKEAKYEQCLEDQKLQREPSTYPSFQPSMNPSFIPSMDPNATSLALNGTADSTSILPIIEPSPTISTSNTTASNSTKNEPIVCKKPKSLQTETIESAIQEVFESQFKRCEDIPQNTRSNSFDSDDCYDAFEDDIELNTTDLLKEMNECGTEALKIADNYKLESVITKSLSDASLSWNWNRCTDNSDDWEQKAAKNLNQIFNPWVDVSYLNPNALDDQAEATWMTHQQDLYCDYVRVGHIEEGKDLSEARYDALVKSFEVASGFENDNCFPNMWAGAWFWFTIMTTVGYGNTAPETDGGRVMIYTLGFVSILVFGVVLGKAGSIVVAIVEDFLLRTRLSFLTRSWIQMIIWGGLYYIWCLLIAAYYIYWHSLRFDGSADVTLEESYWFAYITTTTVGLGDYYLDHAAIIGIDLLIWPLLILYGFVLLAAFLTALGTFVQASDDGTEFADKLAEEQSLFSCFPKWFQRDAEFDAAVSSKGSSIGGINRRPCVGKSDENAPMNESVVDEGTDAADAAIPVLNDGNDGSSS